MREENMTDEFLSVLLNERERYQIKKDGLQKLYDFYERNIKRLDSEIASLTGTAHLQSNPSDKVDNLPELETVNNVQPFILNLKKINTVRERLKQGILQTINHHNRFIHRADVIKAFEDSRIDVRPQAISVRLSELAEENEIIRLRYNQSYTTIFYGKAAWIEVDANGKRKIRAGYEPIGDKAQSIEPKTIEFEWPKAV